jgi:hypothetical protein
VRGSACIQQQHPSRYRPAQCMTSSMHSCISESRRRKDTLALDDMSTRRAAEMSSAKPQTPHTFPTIIVPCTLPSKVPASAAHDQLDLELHDPQHGATIGTFGLTMMLTLGKGWKIRAHTNVSVVDRSGRSGIHAGPTPDTISNHRTRYYTGDGAAISHAGGSQWSSVHIKPPLPVSPGALSLPSPQHLPHGLVQWGRYLSILPN